MKNEVIDEEYGEIVEIDNSAFEESLEEEPEVNDEPVANGQGNGFWLFLPFLHFYELLHFFCNFCSFQTSATFFAISAVL